MSDAHTAVELGADALGFIFADSPRQVTAETVREIAMTLPPFISKIGIFVDEDLQTISNIADSCQLDFIQLHGDRCWDYSHLLSRPFIKAFAVEDATVLEQIRLRRLSHFMLDTAHPQLHGGTGRSFDWEIAREATSIGKVILSGGLNPDNVKLALTVVRPYAVDVCGGVEKGPGVKDAVKMKRFIEEVRNWDSQIN